MINRLIDGDSGDSEEIACNYDGSAVEIIGNDVFIKELRCYPGCGCGGCHEVVKRHVIGAGRFYWKGGL